MTMDEIDNKLEARNIRPTAMRELVLQVFSKRNVALSLTDFEKELHYADKTTLFRTLKTFLKKGLIHTIYDGSGSTKYALCHESCSCSPDELHVHFLCNSCKQTFCLHDIPIPLMSLPKGFTLGGVNMVVKGICANCDFDNND